MSYTLQTASLEVAEQDAKRAEAIIKAKKSRTAELEATIDAVGLYLNALRLSTNPSDRKRIEAKCQLLLSRAESLKDSQNGPSTKSAIPNPRELIRQDLQYPVSRRVPTTRESIIILEGSKLNDSVFKPWKAAPDPAEFELHQGKNQYEEPFRLPLSEEQMEHFNGWRRPEEALKLIHIERNGSALPNAPVMTPIGEVDLVQDLTSDCSVVASLCAGIFRAATGHQKILASIVHPYDHENDRIKISPAGKYILRFWFNGCWRRVEIDDLLPTSRSERLLHVVNRNHPGLLWPALVEKAYLKIRGGYDFPGSNSGTDLAVLTGWIPQQIFLHDRDVDPDSLWEKIHQSFVNGDVLLTMGTGELTDHEQQALGLAALHDYAILELRENASEREMLMKNPWADGDVWKGARRRRSNHPSEESQQSQGSTEAFWPSEDMLMSPGTFWMDFRSVFQYYENLYVSWNPGLFSVRQDVHFTWDLSTSNLTSNVFLNNPQFIVRSSRACEVWLLLNRHFRTGDYTKAEQGRHGHISLYVYDKSGRRVVSNDQPKLRGPYVDSPNTLLTCDLPKDSCFTVVVSSNGLKREKYNFTLSAFSNAELTLQEAPYQYTFQKQVSGAWTQSTAGGNSDCGSYLSNPQITMTLDQPIDIALILSLRELTEDQKKEIFVKVLVLAGDGRRVNRLRARDVVAHSGDYRRGSAVVEKPLPAGKYTIICSTFDVGRCAKFELTAHTSVRPTTGPTLLPAEGSGRLKIFSEEARFTQDCKRLLAPIWLPRTTMAIFIARPVNVNSNPPQNTQTETKSGLFRMALERGQGPYKTLLSSSTVGEQEFSSLENGVRIEDIDLSPQMHTSGTGGLWLVLERSSPTGNGVDGVDVLQVEVLCEERLEIGGWGYGEG